MKNRTKAEKKILVPSSAADPSNFPPIFLAGAAALNCQGRFDSYLSLFPGEARFLFATVCSFTFVDAIGVSTGNWQAFLQLKQGGRLVSAS